MEYAQAQNLVGPSGQQVDVVETNCALLRERSPFDQAVLDGRAYAFASVTYDPDAHDTILGVLNEDTERDFHVQTILFASDTASQIQIFEAAAPTMAGTAVVGVNLNRASGRVAKATAKCDETGNGEQGGGYTKLLARTVVAADVLKQIDVGGAIVIPYGKMIGVDLTTAATGANCTIVGWFE